MEPPHARARRGGGLCLTHTARRWPLPHTHGATVASASNTCGAAVASASHARRGRPPARRLGAELWVGGLHGAGGGGIGGWWWEE